ncbi:MAG: hypothetical protein B6D58_08220 [candidate division Zixibacteria bacterium 4484_95]|nr:MAG: hypothetical protein B6D58_08220 [candidate division Zixibacteria bacterium 4484_95]
MIDQFTEVDRTYSYDNNMRSLLKELKKQKYDTVIDLQKNPRSIIFTVRINPKTVVGLCPGSKHKEKKWHRYQELANLILSEGDKSVIVFSGPDDDFDPNLGISSDKLVAACNLRLDRLAGIMSRCDVVVTNDSGLMHLAVALSVPVVAIFGPTHPSLGFSPLGESDRIICDNVTCSPCSLHGEKQCWMPQKHCFENITPQRVKNELDRIIYAQHPSKIL